MTKIKELGIEFRKTKDEKEKDKIEEDLKSILLELKKEVYNKFKDESDIKKFLDNIINFYARRVAAFEFLKDIYSIELYGDDSVMIMMRDIIKLCNPLSEESRDNIRRRHVIEDDGGLRSILSMYSNETIQKLKSCLESEEGIMMTSTNSFCSLPRINLRDLDL